LTECLPALRPGESRRAVASWVDGLADAPTPGQNALAEALAVQEVCPPGAVYMPGPVQRPTLFLTLHGRAETVVAGQTFTHQPGSLFVMASGSAPVETVGDTQPWHVVYLQLSGPWANELDTWLERRHPAVLVCPAIIARRRHLMTAMLDLALTQAPGWSWPFVAACAELLGGLYAEAPAHSPGDALMERLARLLDNDLAARATLTELAEHVGLTPRQLLYQFGKTSGEPLAGWIRRRRVTAARRLLSQGQSVTSVSERLGYANPYHFSRAFKAVTGVAPSVVRDAALHAWHHLPDVS
jgi:AraC family transcriptional regulator of arabinose operon